MNNIISKNQCTGCSACANVCPKKCITMKPDEEGFLYPCVNEKECINCNLCQKVCPVLSVKSDKNKIVRAYSGHCDNAETVLHSSSGGAFTVICQQILDKGGVVFGATFDNPYNIKHIEIETKDELYRLRGSKYVQSEIGKIYRKVSEYLKKGRWVLFSGVPCQIAALKCYLGKNYDKLLCIDIICHSVPSPKVWKTYLDEKFEIMQSSVIKANFREKQNGWQNYNLCLEFENGEKLRFSASDNLYMQAFIGGLSTRTSCYDCKFKGNNHYSDITLGDFWGVQNTNPDCFYKEGTSLIIVQTDKGSKFLECCKNQLNIKEINFEDAIKYNPAYYSSSVPHRKRQKFFSNLGEIPIDKMAVDYLTPSKTELIKNRIRKSLPVRILYYFKRHFFTINRKNN